MRNDPNNFDIEYILKRVESISKENINTTEKLKDFEKYLRYCNEAILMLELVISDNSSPGQMEKKYQLHRDIGDFRVDPIDDKSSPFTTTLKIMSNLLWDRYTTSKFKRQRERELEEEVGGRETGDTGKSGKPGSLGDREVWGTGKSGRPRSLGDREVWGTEKSGRPRSLGF